MSELSSESLNQKDPIQSKIHKILETRYDTDKVSEI